MIDLLTRRVPGHYWVRLLAYRRADGWLELSGSDRGWLYDGAVRRYGWRLGRVLLVVLRMPRRPRDAI